jgi:RES domain-containing protein
MIVAWRLVKERQADAAFTGEGARLYGGRWNHRGTTVVYLSGSLSLAALELFVHLGPDDIHLRLVSFRVEIPQNIQIDIVEPSILPRDWRNEPPPDSTKEIGTRWSESGRAAVLRVPSVITPVESNFLLNPRHSAFERIKIGDPQPFSFDPRMWK